MEDEGGDVDAKNTCKSLLGGRLAFQPFYREIGEIDFEPGDESRRDANNSEDQGKASSLESSDETSTSLSINDEEELTPPQLNQRAGKQREDSDDYCVAPVSSSNKDCPTPSASTTAPTATQNIIGKPLLSENPLPEPLSFDLVEARIFREGGW